MLDYDEAYRRRRGRSRAGGEGARRRAGRGGYGTEEYRGLRTGYGSGPDRGEGPDTGRYEGRHETRPGEDRRGRERRVRRRRRGGYGAEYETRRDALDALDERFDRWLRTHRLERPARGFPVRGYRTYDLDYGRQAGGPDTDYSGRAGYPIVEPRAEPPRGPYEPRAGRGRELGPRRSLYDRPHRTYRGRRREGQPPD